MKSAKIFVANFVAVLKKSFFKIITYFFIKVKFKQMAAGAILRDSGRKSLEVKQLWKNCI